MLDLIGNPEDRFSHDTAQLELSEDLTIAPPYRFQRTKIYRGLTMFEKLMVHNNPDVDLVSDNEYTKFG